MLRSKLRSWVKLLLIVVIISPVVTSGLTAQKKEPVDLSILAQEDSLIAYMRPAQRLEHVQLESAMDSAESDKRSGQHLMQTQPSTFAPDRDIQPMIKRGEELVARAEQKIAATQEAMVELLSEVESQKIVQVASDLTKYDYALSSALYEEAIIEQCQQLLETCWELGYETLFYDGAFLQDNEGTRRVGAELRNNIYDTLVKIDGTKFSVVIPVDFELREDTTGKSSHIFNYENIAIFQEDKKALLAIELILPEGSSSGLLSLRAIDLDTQLIAAHVLVKVTDLSETIGLVGLRGLRGLESAELQDILPNQIELRDEARTLETLSQLTKPYAYELQAEVSTTEVPELLTYTLLQNSNLQITDSDFILRAYGEALEVPEAWVGLANASITIEATDETGSYQLKAQAEDSNRVLPGGILTLSQSSPRALAESHVEPK